MREGGGGAGRAMRADAHEEGRSISAGPLLPPFLGQHRRFPSRSPALLLLTLSKALWHETKARELSALRRAPSQPTSAKHGVRHGSFEQDAAAGGLDKRAFTN